MVSIAIMIGTPAGTRLMAATAERDAARMAEAVLIDLDRTALPVPVWVQCGDAGVRARLDAYLAAFQAELTAIDA